MTPTKVLGIRLTDDERDLVDRAKIAGMTAAAWAKARVLGTSEIVAGGKPEPTLSAVPDPVGDSLKRGIDQGEQIAARPAVKRATRKAGLTTVKGSCDHPINRRIGGQCALCGEAVAGKR